MIDLIFSLPSHQLDSDLQDGLSCLMFVSKANMSDLVSDVIDNYDSNVDAVDVSALLATRNPNPQSSANQGPRTEGERAYIARVQPH